MSNKRSDYGTGEPLEFFGPALSADYDPPGLWEEWDAVDLDGRARVPAKCGQLELFPELARVS
jgi:hypothetical protein